MKMVQCCFLCKWRADKEPRRSFHKFPSKESDIQKWLSIIGKSGVNIGKRTSVCSIHFEKSCFRYGLVNNREMLKPDCVPSLNLTKTTETSKLVLDNPPELSVTESSLQDCINENCSDITASTYEELQSNDVSMILTKNSDVSPSLIVDSNAASHNMVHIIDTAALQKLQALLMQKNTIIANLQQTVQRMQQRERELRKEIFSLKKKNSDCRVENELLHTKSSINQDRNELSGFNKTPIDQMIIVEVCPTESIAIKEELPDVSEELDDIVEIKEECQSDEIKAENIDDSCLLDTAVVAQRSESYLENDVPFMEFKIEVKEEDVSNKKQRAVDMRSATDAKKPKLGP